MIIVFMMHILMAQNIVFFVYIFQFERINPLVVDSTLNQVFAAVSDALGSNQEDMVKSLKP